MIAENYDRYLPVVLRWVVILFLLLCAPGHIFAGIEEEEMQEAIEATKDQWEALRQTMQQGSSKLKEFESTYQEYEDKIFSQDMEKSIAFACKLMRCEPGDQRAAKKALKKVRDTFNTLDKNGLKTSLKSASKKLKLADKVAGEVTNVFQFAEKFNPANAKDNPTYGLRLIATFLKEGAGKFAQVPLVGEILGKWVAAYGEVADDFANALDRLSDKIRDFRQSVLCGSMGTWTSQQRAFRAAATADYSNESCQTYFEVKVFRRLHGQAYEGNGNYFLYDPATERGYFCPTAKTQKVYNWYELLWERKALKPDWLARRARSLKPDTVSGAYAKCRKLRSWSEKADKEWVIIEAMNAMGDVEYYGRFDLEEVVANYILTQTHRKKIDDIIAKFENHVFVSGKVSARKEGSEHALSGATVSFEVAGKRVSQSTGAGGDYEMLIEGKPGSSVNVTVAHANHQDYTTSGNWPEKVVLGWNFTLAQAGEENPTDSTPAADDLNNQVDTVVGNLEAAVRDAEQDEREACSLSSTAVKDINNAASDAVAVEAELDGYEAKLKEFASKIQQMARLVDKAAVHRTDAEKGAVEMGHLAHKMEALQQSVCGSAESLSQVRTEHEHRSISSTVDSQEAKIRPLLQQARNQLDSVETAAKEARRIQGEVQSFMGGSSLLTEEKNTALILKRKAWVLKETTANLSNVKEGLENVSKRKEQADKLAAKGRELLGTMTSSVEVQDKLNLIQALLGRVNQALERAMDCSSEVDLEISTASQKLSTQQDRLERLSRLRSELFAPDGGQVKGVIARGAEAADGAEYLFAVAGAYMKRVHAAATEAGVCCTLAEDIKFAQQESQNSSQSGSGGMSGSSTDTSDAGSTPAEGSGRESNEQSGNTVIASGEPDSNTSRTSNTETRNPPAADPTDSQPDESNQTGRGSDNISDQAPAEPIEAGSDPAQDSDSGFSEISSTTVVASREPVSNTNRTPGAEPQSSSGIDQTDSSGGFGEISSNTVIVSREPEPSGSVTPSAEAQSPSGTNPGGRGLAAGGRDNVPSDQGAQDRWRQLLAQAEERRNQPQTNNQNQQQTYSQRQQQWLGVMQTMSNIMTGMAQQRQQQRDDKEDSVSQSLQQNLYSGRPPVSSGNSSRSFDPVNSGGFSRPSDYARSSGRSGSQPSSSGGSASGGVASADTGTAVDWAGTWALNATGEDGSRTGGQLKIRIYNGMVSLLHQGTQIKNIKMTGDTLKFQATGLYGGHKTYFDVPSYSEAVTAVSLKRTGNVCHGSFENLGTGERGTYDGRRVEN